MGACTKVLLIKSCGAQRCVLPVSFPLDYYCHSNKSTGKETGKTHLCTVHKPINAIFILCCEKSPNLTCYLKLKVHTLEFRIRMYLALLFPAKFTYLLTLIEAKSQTKSASFLFGTLLLFEGILWALFFPLDFEGEIQ